MPKVTQLIVYSKTMYNLCFKIPPNYINRQDGTYRQQAQCKL